MIRRLVTLILLASATPLAAQWLTLATPGIPRTADGAPDLSAPAPRTADGRLDLTGLWRSVGAGAGSFDATKIQTWARTLMVERERNYYADGPHFRCLPTGPGSIISSGEGGYRRFVQSPTVVAILNGDGTYRQIFMDGRELESDPLPNWMGYSVGRWDGDTLVVESNGFNAKTWLHNEGLSHTESLRVTERYRRVDFGHMQVDVTYEDPGVFDSPQHVSFSLVFAADDEMLETVCAEAPQGNSTTWVGEKITDAEQTVVDVDEELLAKYVGTYEGYWLDNWTTVEVTLQDGSLFLQRNGGATSLLLPQSENTFVCRTCRWGQPYVFSREGDGMATEVAEVQVSGAWIFKRVE